MAGPILAVFHMDGCPHCEAVTGPAGACARLKNVSVLEVESRHPLVRDVNITSFPHLWLSTPDAVWEFNGSRTTDALQAWIGEKLGTTAL